MKWRVLSLGVAVSAILSGPAAGDGRETAGAAPKPPVSPVKLVFIHHSTGEGWLADDGGRLGVALRDNNYFVSDTNYGWGPDAIGDSTDTGHWWAWFRGPRRDAYLDALFKESGQNASYSRLARDPGGENRIVLFKSCFPNSSIAGRPGDAPRKGANPLRGQDSSSPWMTVANVKGIYNDLLAYFSTRTDKLFVLVASPPLVPNATDAAHAANARAVHDWLVTDWLKPYPHANVAVFDLFTVLTSNGGSTDVSDLGRVAGNHHRYRNGAVEHPRTVNNNTSAYGSTEDDSHPTAAGGRKASGEFAPLLNLYFARWKAGTKAPQAGTVTPSSGSVAAGAAVNFKTTWSDANGSNDLKECLFLVGAGTSPSASAYVFYDPLAGKLYLRSQDGSKWTGGYAPGSAHTIRNGQVGLNCARTIVLIQTGTVAVTWNLTFVASYAGPRSLYLKATDKGKRTSGWKKKGAVTIVS